MTQAVSAAPCASQPLTLGRPDDEQEIVAVEAHCSTARICEAHEGVERSALHCATHDVSGLVQVALPRAQTPSQVAALGGCCMGGGAGGFLTQSARALCCASQLAVTGAPEVSQVTAADARHALSAESRSLHVLGTAEYSETHWVSHWEFAAEHMPVARCAQIVAQEVPLEPPPPDEAPQPATRAKKRSIVPPRRRFFIVAEAITEALDDAITGRRRAPASHVD